MKKFCLMLCFIALVHAAQAQQRLNKLRTEVEQLVKDSQLRHGQLSFVVLDAKSGSTLFQYNAQTGLAPASTQKIFTAIAAFDLLGPEYRYSTSFSVDTSGSGSLFISPSGDPTFGSDRWSATSETAIISGIKAGLRTANVPLRAGMSVHFTSLNSTKLVPEGWIWQDIGNYYGAGAQDFNWRENQFDIFFKTGTAVGDHVAVSGVNPAYLDSLQFNVDALKTAAKGSGDNGYVYFDVWKNNGFNVAGTLPAGEERFPLSAAHPDPKLYFQQMLRANGINIIKGTVQPHGNNVPLYTHLSPRLDSIVYWFLQRSINLYGEALINTIARERSKGMAAIEGPDALRTFWKERGIDEASLHILDGSGLSPQNRVTSQALATALVYARKQSWFDSFYRALPIVNGQHMKSGSIEGARAYAGYQQAGDGSEYIFAVIVNNYDGSSSLVTRKLWKLLDVLK